MKLKVLLSAVLILTLGIAVHALTVRGLPGNLNNTNDLRGLSKEASPFESSHERAPYAEMLSILQRGTIQLSKPLADFGSPDIGFDGKRYFSFFPSGVSASMIPMYLLGSNFNMGQVSAYFTMGIFTTLTMLFIFLICRHTFGLPLWASIIAPITYAFGTTAWSYSVTIYQHAPAALFSMAMFYCAWQYKQKTRKQFLWAAAIWFIFGISLFFDYPNALVLLAFMVFFALSSVTVSAVKRKRKVVRLTVNSAILRAMPIFIILVIWHGWHNNHFLGAPTQIGNNFPRYTIKTPAQIKAEKTDAAKRKKAQEAAELEKLEKSSGGIAKALTEDKVPLNAKTLLFGIDKGLFLFSPVVIMALLGIITLKKKHLVEKSVLLAFILGNILIYASFGDPYGGWAFGPRYLVPAMAGLSIFIAIGLAETKLQILRKVAYVILFGISSGIALAGAITTNLVPPKVEADFLKLDYYNFSHNFDLLRRNTSTSYVYNTYFKPHMSLIEYAEYIWIALYAIIVFVTFILPLFVHEPAKKEAAK